MALTIEQIIRQSSQLLAPVSDSAKLDVELLLAKAIGKDRTYLFTWCDKMVSNEDKSIFDVMFDRRMQGEPIAYILGQQEFWNMTFNTASHTLIPRADTETLIEWSLDLAELLPENARVIDLGTGTGAIALVMAKENPRWKVQAVDVIPQVVELAKQNAKINHLNRVEIYQSSWFEKVDGVFDLIVSNPPYIDPDDDHLNRGDVRFEPKSALVADKNGLADLELIADQARQYLVNGGWLLMEHGYDQQEQIQAICIQLGYQKVVTRTDLGGNPRITGGQFFYE
jgi:release factor glutamine methyltransferase